MKKLIIFFFASFIAILCSGCSTLADAQAAKGSGQFKVYDKPYDVVWNTTIEVVKSSGLDFVSDSKEKGSILAQQGISALSYGENVAVFVEKVNETKTRVEVIDKRALATTVLSTNWENKIMQALDKKLLQ